MDVAIIGLGNMGIRYTKLLMEDKTIGLNVIAITEPKDSKKDVIKDYLDDLIIYKNDDELFKGFDNNEFKCDAVIIATPHYNHIKCIKEAFIRGLHVLCEKPIGVVLKDTKDLLEYNKNNLLCGFILQHRTFSINKYLFELLKNKEYGDVIRISFISTDWFRTNQYFLNDGWRGNYKTDGGGLLMNQCPHYLDLICFLFGLPKKVRSYAFYGRFHNIEVEDEITSYLEWENGINGTFVASSGDAYGINRLEITTSKALITVYPFHIDINTSEHDSSYYIKECIDKSDIKYITKRINFEYDKSQVEVLRRFANKDLVCDFNDALKSLYLANAMYLSSFKNKDVILYDIGTKEEELFEEEFIEELNKRK